ncbi:MAG: VOC family protein [Bacteroidia bacterium]|nr:VOC family protein [Bacteroidia bacterium]
MEKISEKTNALNWFEIPVTDTPRAKKFYETILDIRMETTEMMGMEITFFPFDTEGTSGKVSGALVKNDLMRPSMDGPVIYLNANPDIQAVIDRIEGAGGKVLMPRTEIGDNMGYMAFFVDSEGNRMALHADN